MCEESGKWIFGVDEPEIMVEGDDEAEVLPDSGECGAGERKMKKVIDPLHRAQRKSLNISSRIYIFETGAPIVFRGGRRR